MDLRKILWIAISYMMAVCVAIPLGNQDDTGRIPLLKPQGRFNPKLKTAVRQLMITLKKPR